MGQIWTLGTKMVCWMSQFWYKSTNKIRQILVLLGIIQWFEKKIGHEVHWDICQLHFNELPLRELFNRLDGVTLGPRQFSGPIGKMLVACEQRPIKSFQPIFSDDLPILRDDVVKGLSTDQQYLYKICHAIQSGIVNNSLANMKPGPMVFSRFLTTACRVLR